MKKAKVTFAKPKPKPLNVAEKTLPKVVEQSQQSSLPISFTRKGAKRQIDPAEKEKNDKITKLEE